MNSPNPASFKRFEQDGSSQSVREPAIATEGHVQFRNLQRAGACLLATRWFRRFSALCEQCSSCTQTKIANSRPGPRCYHCPAPLTTWSAPLGVCRRLRTTASYLRNVVGLADRGMNWPLRLKDKDIRATIALTNSKCSRSEPHKLRIAPFIAAWPTFNASIQAKPPGLLSPGETLRRVTDSRRQARQTI